MQIKKKIFINIKNHKQGPFFSKKARIAKDIEILFKNI